MGRAAAFSSARAAATFEKRSGRRMAKAKTADADAGGDGAGKKPGLMGKFSRKTIIMAAGGLVVIGGGFGAFALMHKPHEEKKVEIAAPKPAVFFDVPEVMVNLSNGGSSERTQYLKVKAVLEVPDQALVAQIQPVMPRVLDAFQTYLRELRASDLDGSAGLYRLKEELTRRVNTAIAPNKVTAVLFKEIVVQ